MLNFCNFIQVYVFTTSNHPKGFSQKLENAIVDKGVTALIWQ